MENQNELLVEILKLEQRNYTELLEIERLTKELADTLSRNDRDSVQLLLEMRKNEMDKASETKRKIYAILEAVDSMERKTMASLLNGCEPEESEDELAKRLVSVSRQMKSVLERTIDIDKVISRKLAGKASFYENQ